MINIFDVEENKFNSLTEKIEILQNRNCFIQTVHQQEGSFFVNNGNGQCWILNFSIDINDNLTVKTELICNMIDFDALKLNLSKSYIVNVNDDELLITCCSYESQTSLLRFQRDQNGQMIFSNMQSLFTTAFMTMCLKERYNKVQKDYLIQGYFKQLRNKWKKGGYCQLYIEVFPMALFSLLIKFYSNSCLMMIDDSYRLISL